MPLIPRKKAVCLAILFVGIVTSARLVAAKRKEKTTEAAMEGQKRALHALNRLTFGPRPGEVERVTAMGVDKWIDLQLHPDKLDDTQFKARLAPLRTLAMSTQEIVENFPPPALIKAVAEGKANLPRDPARRAIYQAQLERYQEQQERKQVVSNNLPAPNPVSSGNSSDPATSTQGASGEAAKRREAKLYADLEAEQLLGRPPDQRMKEILKLAPEEQRDLAQAKRRDDLLEGMSAQQKETLMALNNPQQVVEDELRKAKVLRAAYSERQLQEVMTDFWFNHFNVFIDKGADRYLLTSYERDVIRPHALGKFQDLLVATAKSPAMLFYLDNWLSVGPNSELALGIPHASGPRRARRSPPLSRTPAKKKERRGLNENYGRELMELHTLGVNGGYSQRDVTEVARVLTGWTIDQPRKGGGFKFEPRMHEPGSKTVLGHKIRENGEKEGLQLLEILAHHPSTAQFISRKLAMRFVSDDPPSSLVNRMAETFRKKDGDIREVLRTLFRAPEFWAPQVYRAKVKTPLELMISSLRATGADVQDPTPLIRALNNMGMPLYGMQPPTGYSMKAESWVSSSALLSRMNFALALSNNRLKGTTVDPANFAGPDPRPQGPASLAWLESNLLGGDVSHETHETLLKQLDDPQIAERKLDDPWRPPNVAALVGLILGSPEFQRR